jgi:Zn-dependent M28 family amino/carboxypeptidase
MIPMTRTGLFTRSDHYRFVQEGIPSVFLMTGFGNGGERQFKNFSPPTTTSLLTISASRSTGRPEPSLPGSTI